MSNSALCRSQEVGPVFVWFILHRPAVYTMNPDDIKVSPNFHFYDSQYTTLLLLVI